MKRSSMIACAILLFALLPAALFAAPYTVVTYNLGLLRVFGSDLVPAVDARTAAAPRALSAFVTRVNPQVMLLEEVWEDTAAYAITQELAPLGYAATRPSLHGILGLGSGLLLFVKAPLRIAEWTFTPFARSTFFDSFVRKGVLEATVEDAATGARFALVGTHTVAVDTNNGAPTDRSQIEAITSQADQVTAAVTARSVHSELPALLLGDFNVGPGYADVAYRRLLSLDGLRESGEAIYPGAPLVTWDPSNPLVKFGGYPNEPAAKIDHVFLRDGASSRWTPTAARADMSDPVPGLTFIPKGASSPVATPLSDHYAFVAEVDLAPSDK
jgi:hypothetical protein